MVDMAILLGAEPKRAKSEMEDALRFEIKLAEVSPRIVLATVWWISSFVLHLYPQSLNVQNKINKFWPLS